MTKKRFGAMLGVYAVLTAAYYGASLWISKKQSDKYTKLVTERLFPEEEES